jgi:hypothetical protein
MVALHLMDTTGICSERHKHRFVRDRFEILCQNAVNASRNLSACHRVGIKYYREHQPRQKQNENNLNEYINPSPERIHKDYIPLSR